MEAVIEHNVTLSAKIPLDAEIRVSFVKRSAEAALTTTSKRLKKGLAGTDPKQAHSTMSIQSTMDETAEISMLPKYDEPFAYNMNHENRGLFVIFANEIFSDDKNLDKEQKDLFQKDIEALQNSGRKLGFKVKAFVDLTAGEVIKTIEEYGNIDHSGYDCFVCAVLTHGTTGDRLCASDIDYELNRLTKPFGPEKCRTLAGKPKLFFILACRGDGEDKGSTHTKNPSSKYVKATKLDMDGLEIVKIPVEADFLLAHSSPPNYCAWIDKNGAGSFFIQALCKCLDKYGSTLELLQILTRVNYMVAHQFETDKGYKQMPSFNSRLTRDLYFSQKEL